MRKRHIPDGVFPIRRNPIRRN